MLSMSNDTLLTQRDKDWSCLEGPGLLIQLKKWSKEFNAREEGQGVVPTKSEVGSAGVVSVCSWVRAWSKSYMSSITWEFSLPLYESPPPTERYCPCVPVQFGPPFPLHLRRPRIWSDDHEWPHSYVSLFFRTIEDNTMPSTLTCGTDDIWKENSHNQSVAPSHDLLH